MRAGVFDSGVGGLTVVKSLLESKLFDEIIYYGDTARVPYGTKDKNTIIRYSLEALEFFKNFDIDIFIAACNTVSAYAISELNESASIPVVGVVEPGVLATMKKLQDRDAKLLVLGTKATVNSDIYKNMLIAKGYKNITQIATGLFVPIVEEGLLDGEVLQSTINHYFGQNCDFDGVILGCTHFPLIANPLQSHFKRATLIHSGEAIVEYLSQNYGYKIGEGANKVKYFASENPEGLKRVAKSWLTL